MRVATALALLLPVIAFTDERITEFHSEVVIMAAGWIDVIETIEVEAEGKRIRRGIYRDFPTDYVDKFGNNHRVAFEPLSVLRNGQPEDFHTERLSDGVRVYFGHKNRFLKNGGHAYTFRYRASRVLGFFPDHDELYWNVTGFDWAFPIDSASAAVSFQFEPPRQAITAEAYTGPFGATERDYSAEIDRDGRVTFRALAPLSPANGLTIVVGWPKGFVTEPTDVDRIGWLLKDNLNLLVALGGLVALVVYYVPVWRYFGRDPEPGVVVTRYEPPEGFSPASLRYIRQMYYDDKVMTAAVVNLAVKGYLRIEVDEGKDGILGIKLTPDEFRLIKTDPGSAARALAAGEQELHDALFRNGSNVVLKNTNHELLEAAKAAHRDSLRADYRQHYFRLNGLLNLPAIGIAAVTAIIALGIGSSPLVIAVVVTMLLTVAFFAIVMKRPTMRGRQVLDSMLGFKDYLEVAEKDEMNLRHPPDKTPQLFEAYLPYALALGVDQEWAERFAGILGAVQENGRSGYRPSWYNGSWNSLDLSRTTHALAGGLSGAISSSVSPPGSTSGGGGGGFSGGGGGGGGGGGW